MSTSSEYNHTDGRVAQWLPVNIMALFFQSFIVRLPLSTFYHLSRVTPLSVFACPKDTESCFISHRNNLLHIVTDTNSITVHSKLGCHIKTWNGSISDSLQSAHLLVNTVSIVAKILHTSEFNSDHVHLVHHGLLSYPHMSLFTHIKTFDKPEKA